MGKSLSATEQFMAEKAEAIRTIGRTAVFGIGKHLAEVREKCPHGMWAPWLQSQFGWSYTHADNYMKIYAAMRDGKFQQKLEFGLSVSSLALLASPSTPDKAVAEVTGRVEGGEQLTRAQVKGIVEERKPALPEPPVRPEPPPEAYSDRPMPASSPAPTSPPRPPPAIHDPVVGRRRDNTMIVREIGRTLDIGLQQLASVTPDEALRDKPSGVYVGAIAESANLARSAVDTVLNSLMKDGAVLCAPGGIYRLNSARAA